MSSTFQFLETVPQESCFGSLFFQCKVVLLNTPGALYFSASLNFRSNSQFPLANKDTGDAVAYRCYTPCHHTRRYALYSFDILLATSICGRCDLVQSCVSPAGTLCTITHNVYFEVITAMSTLSTPCVLHVGFPSTQRHISLHSKKFF